MLKILQSLITVGHGSGMNAARRAPDGANGSCEKGWNNSPTTDV